jgi:hypothetical protein
MLKTKTDLTNHIKNLIAGGELNPITFYEWLAWGGYATLYVELRVAELEKELAESEDKEFYLEMTYKRFVLDGGRLNVSSLHAKNEFDLITLEAYSRFLRKHAQVKVTAK